MSACLPASRFAGCAVLAILVAACGRSPPAMSPEDAAAYARYGPVHRGEMAVVDIDGDGASDLLVGLPSYPGNRGRVAVWLGGPRFIGRLPSFLLEEPGEPSGSFGRAVANAGDVDGDGLSDVVVGAPSPEPCDRSSARGLGGRVFLFRGGKGKVSRLPAAEVDGDVHVGGFGAGFDGSGDVDGDGYSDVLVYAAGGVGIACAPGGPGVSAVLPTPIPPALYLLRGSPAGLSGEGAFLTSAPGRRIVGDHDRDGRADVLPIGDTGALGKHDPLVFVWADRVPGYQIGLGDVDGDGFVDLVMNGSNSWRGRVLVYRGGNEGLHEPPARHFIGPLRQSASVLATPENIDFLSQTAFGQSIATTDIDHDGFADVLVGAPWDDKLYVYPGHASLPATAPAHVIRAVRQGDWFPEGMVTGDFNRDGFGDVVASNAGEHDAHGTRARPWLFVYMGSRKGLAAEPDAVVRLDDIGE